MRIVTASVIIAALSLGAPAFVQAQGSPSQSQASPSQSEAQPTEHPGRRRQGPAAGGAFEGR
jgi:hypothetical protein